MTVTLTKPQQQQVFQPSTAVDLLPLVYLAAPYTRPDPVANTHAVIRIADALLEAGFTPFIPHLTLAWHLVSPKRYGTWLEYDCGLLARCDAVLRVPGVSEGVTREIRFAESLCIPVVYPRSAAPADCVAALTAFFSRNEEPE